MPVRRLSPSRLRRHIPIVLSIAVALLAAGQARAVWQPADAFVTEAGEPAGHLVISELLAGATSASDEFIELFNPTSVQLPTEGLEVVYVTASGATVTRKAAWAAGTPTIAAGAHLLIANEAGVYAAIADATYAGGLAATGGSVALRIQAATGAIDALAWGNAASTWREGTPAPATAAGSSLERLPGGSTGSFQDTDDNVVDFVARDAPDPQNSASPPIAGGGPSPTGTATPGPSATVAPSPASLPSPTPNVPSPTPSAMPSPSSTPSPTPPLTPGVISIADARQTLDGETVSISGTAVTDGAFSDGGGYLADSTGGIAILVSDGSFARGRELQVTGTLDTRYQQRTVRTSVADIVDLGSAAEPGPLHVSTGTVGEGVEAILVAIEGEVVSSATALANGLAYDVDDGSGPIRVLVSTSTGIDTSAWQRGAALAVVGVVGQRDASGTGTAGYRVQPRDVADVQLAPPPPDPTPSASPSATASPAATATPSNTPSPNATPTPSDDPGTAILPIAQARAAATGTAVTVRGVVTVASGVIDPTSAIIQDASGGIVLRLSDDAGKLRRGQLVQVVGKRSTKGGMVTLRVSEPPSSLGSQAEPAAVRKPTGSLGEELEAQLVVARGALTAKPRRSSAGTVSFGIDDGSGEVRVVISSESKVDLGEQSAGTWIEVRGALGQETTGSQPLRGYRIWPRDGSDVEVLAEPPLPATGSTRGGSGSANPGGDATKRIDPSTVRLTALDRGSATAAKARVERERSPRAADPVLAGRRQAAGSASATPFAEAAAAVLPRPSRDPIPIFGSLALALAALAGLAFVAWRDARLARLVAVVRRMVDRSDGAELERPTDAAQPPDAMPDGDVTEPLPRLTVIRVPHERTVT